MYRHLVLFRMHDDIDNERVTEAIAALRSLAGLPGVESWNVELSLDHRKGRVIVEDATFASTEAFEAFRDSDRHRLAGRLMAETSDWWIGDYIT